LLLSNNHQSTNCTRRSDSNPDRTGTSTTTREKALLLCVDCSGRRPEAALSSSPGRLIPQMVAPSTVSNRPSPMAVTTVTKVAVLLCVLVWKSVTV
jgi:hypothetical protein